jgi:hypothetical protein
MSHQRGGAGRKEKARTKMARGPGRVHATFTQLSGSFPAPRPTTLQAPVLLCSLAVARQLPVAHCWCGQHGPGAAVDMARGACSRPAAAGRICAQPRYALQRRLTGVHTAFKGVRIWRPAQACCPCCVAACGAVAVAAHERGAGSDCWRCLVRIGKLRRRALDLGAGIAPLKLAYLHPNLSQISCRRAAHGRCTRHQPHRLRLLTRASCCCEHPGCTPGATFPATGTQTAVLLRGC